MATSDLHGVDAERSCPPAIKTALIIIRRHGHQIAVRKSARTGSWFYRVDGGREIKGLALCEKFRSYGI